MRGQASRRGSCVAEADAWQWRVNRVALYQRTRRQVHGYDRGGAGHAHAPEILSGVAVDQRRCDDSEIAHGAPATKRHLQHLGDRVNRRDYPPSTRVTAARSGVLRRHRAPEIVRYELPQLGALNFDDPGARWRRGHWRSTRTASR